MVLEQRTSMGKKSTVKMDGFPPLTEEDLYFVRKLISHIIPESTDVINKSGWSEACKQSIEKVTSLNRHYFFSAFGQNNVRKEPEYPLYDEDTEF